MIRDLLINIVASVFVAVMCWLGGWWMRGSHEAGKHAAEQQEVLDAHHEQASRLAAVARTTEQGRIANEWWRGQQRSSLLEWLDMDAADGCSPGLDPVGLLLWNAANAGAPAAASAAAGAAGAVSPPATGSGRGAADAGGEPRGGDAGTGRMRAPPGGTGAVDRSGESAGQ